MVICAMEREDYDRCDRCRNWKADEDRQSINIAGFDTSSVRVEVDTARQNRVSSARLFSVGKLTPSIPRPAVHAYMIMIIMDCRSPHALNCW